jgi:hypothetical protein
MYIAAADGPQPEASPVAVVVATVTGRAGGSLVLVPIIEPAVPAPPLLHSASSQLEQTLTGPGRLSTEHFAAGALHPSQAEPPPADRDSESDSDLPNATGLAS